MQYVKENIVSCVHHMISCRYYFIRDVVVEDNIIRGGETMWIFVMISA